MLAAESSALISMAVAGEALKPQTVVFLLAYSMNT
jgi:hypothetical protein